jgi:hypothetical protein
VRSDFGGRPVQFLRRCPTRRETSRRKGLEKCQRLEADPRLSRGAPNHHIISDTRKRAHLGLTGMTFRIVSRRAAHVGNPPGVKEQAAGVSEKCPNQPSIALSCFLSRSPYAALATLVLTRESILFRVPPFSQCFRGG